jgi:hypothetical protein
MHLEERVSGVDASLVDERGTRDEGAESGPNFRRAASGLVSAR